jgi:hypothetical protein
MWMLACWSTDILERPGTIPRMTMRMKESCRFPWLVECLSDGDRKKGNNDHWFDYGFVNRSWARG